ncbi:DUF3397 domain-containing protein [Sporosarcina sp. CAU 1771]
MGGLISVFLGVLIIFPFLVTLLVLMYLRKKGKAPSKSIGFAADVTTPFLFIAVYVCSRVIFEIGTVFYIAVISVIIPIIFAVIERFKGKDFRIGLILRRSWRLYFIILSFAYILLLVAGIVLKIVEYAF